MRGITETVALSAAGSTAMAVRAIAMQCLGAFMMSVSNESASAALAGHITDVGGVFFKAKAPKTLAAWYRDVLGLPLDAWGGAALRYDASAHPPVLVWNAFPASTDYFAPSTSGFIINYSVDDTDAFLNRLHAKGVAILKQDDMDQNSRFAWIVDPEDSKIEPGIRNTPRRLERSR
jgi:catechol 2,3-dioxygenase-like lactoylglutathione lyase family enzyme